MKEKAKKIRTKTKQDMTKERTKILLAKEENKGKMNMVKSAKQEKDKGVKRHLQDMTTKDNQ